MERGENLLTLVGSTRVNALLGWLLIGFVLSVAVASAARGDLLWAGFATVVAVLALVPTLVRRSAREMLPWEVLALAALPLIGRALATETLAGQFATYLAVAAIALIIAVELDVFTSVAMTASFAVVFVVVATTATAGIWAVVRWGLDVSFGTEFLLDATRSEHAIEQDLMWEFVYSTAAGLLGGLTFEGYFRRRANAGARLSHPDS